MSYKSAPRLDATNIAEITTLMNQQYIKGGINLQQIENTIMNKDIKKESNEFDPMKYYSNEINKLAEELGVDLDNNDTTGIAQIETVIEEDRISKKSKSSSSKSSSSKSSSSESSEESRLSEIRDIAIKEDGSIKKSSWSSDTSHKSRVESVRSKATSFTRHKKDLAKNLDREMGIDISNDKYKKRYILRDHGHVKKETNDLDDIMDRINKENKTSHGSEREKTQDIKLSKIEQISQLKMTLEEEGINCDGIKNPDIDMSLGEIDSILNVLDCIEK